MDAAKNDGRFVNIEDMETENRREKEAGHVTIEDSETEEERETIKQARNETIDLTKTKKMQNPYNTKKMELEIVRVQEEPTKEKKETEKSTTTKKTGVTNQKAPKQERQKRRDQDHYGPRWWHPRR